MAERKISDSGGHSSRERNMVRRTSKSPPGRRPGNITAVIHELDAQHSLGMHGSGDDWSKLPNSQRTDRPLDPETLRELTQKSDFLGLSRFGGNCALIVLTGFAILAAADRWREGWPVPVLAVLSIWQGFLLSALGFACQHECLHYTAFRTLWLNGFVGRLSSLPSFAFYLHEKAMHKEHHTFTQDLTRDPELVAEVLSRSLPRRRALCSPDPCCAPRCFSGGRLHLRWRRLRPARGRRPGGRRGGGAQRLQEGAAGPVAVHPAPHQPVGLPRVEAQEVLLLLQRSALRRSTYAHAPLRPLLSCRTRRPPPLKVLACADLRPMTPDVAHLPPLLSRHPRRLLVRRLASRQLPPRPGPHAPPQGRGALAGGHHARAHRPVGGARRVALAAAHVAAARAARPAVPVLRAAARARRVRPLGANEAPAPARKQA